MPCDTVSTFKADFDPKRLAVLEDAAKSLGLAITVISEGHYTVIKNGRAVAEIQNGEITARSRNATLANDLRNAYADTAINLFKQQAKAQGWQVQQLSGGKQRVFKQ